MLTVKPNKTGHAYAVFPIAGPTAGDYTLTFAQAFGQNETGKGTCQLTLP